MRYQFLIDAKPAAPSRDTINEAALDAMESGFARSDRQGRIVLDDCADIVPIKTGPTLQ
jgi:hypothetical protein